MNDESQSPGDDGDIALAELFSQYRPRLERLVAFRLDSRLKSRIDCHDVLQEAYIEIARRHAEYQKAARLSIFVWMRQITLQTLIDLQRRHFGQKRHPGNEVKFSPGTTDGTSDSIVHALGTQMTSPSGVAIRAEEIAQLNSALAQMDETDREVLALRHFEHLGNREVAEALGLSITAASNRYIRAMARLAEIMRNCSLPEV